MLTNQLKDIKEEVTKLSKRLDQSSLNSFSSAPNLTSQSYVQDKQSSYNYTQTPMQELTPIKNCIEGVSVSINNNISKPPTNGNFDGKAPAGIRINQENKERGGKSRQNSRGSHKSSGSNPEWWGDQHLNDKKNQVTSKITGKAPPKLDDNHVIVARPKYVDGCESNKVDLNKLKNMQDHLG